MKNRGGRRKARFHAPEFSISRPSSVGSLKTTPENSWSKCFSPWDTKIGQRGGTVVPRRESRGVGTPCAPFSEVTRADTEDVDSPAAGRRYFPTTSFYGGRTVDDPTEEDPQ